MRSSQRAFLMIIGFEVSDEATYNRLYRPPTWPGGASGVTIGIGWDCGYATAAEISAAWSAYLTPDMIMRLCGAAGMTGARAQVETHKLRIAVSVSWTAAMAVFQNRDMPKWEGLVEKTLPNADLLSGDSFGSLVSIAYNRGASFSAEGDRYLEMREIHANMAAKNFAAIPGNIRSMVRLWPNVPGLQSRRRQEADLFQAGLSEPTGQTQPAHVSVDPIPVPAPAKPHAYNVAWIQRQINRAGHQPPINVDSDYGPQTLAAVKWFQSTHGLAQDGIAGPQTLAKLSEVA